MGQDFSVENSGECIAQDDNPLMVVNKHCITDGKKVYSIHADKPKKSKKNAEDELPPSWKVHDAHGNVCYKVDYRFKFTQQLIDQNKTVLATLDKNMYSTFYTKNIFCGDSFEEEDLVSVVARRLSHYKAEMHAKVYDLKNKKCATETIKVKGNKKDRTFVVVRGDDIIAKSYRMDKFVAKNGHATKPNHNHQDTYYLEIASGVDGAFVVALAVAMNRFMRKK